MMQVMDPETMQAVPADGVAMGEIMMRGNIVMKGPPEPIVSLPISSLGIQATTEMRRPQREHFLADGSTQVRWIAPCTNM